VRTEISSAVEPALNERTRSWLVRTEPQKSDWLHEREWRVPCADPSDAWLPLASEGLVAILVGDPEWEPTLVDDVDLNPMTGNPAHVQKTPQIAQVPRWFWNGKQIEQLSPVPARIDYYLEI
jgi:hypothetical protein